MSEVATGGEGGRVFAVIPAAGAGKRMGKKVAKQYLKLRGKTVLAHTLSLFLSTPRVSAIAVALSVDDTQFEQLAEARDPRVLRVAGGAERADSVLNAIAFLLESGHCDRRDWVLVHDAARPCLRRSDLMSVLDAAQVDEVGAILALPIRDTVKRADVQGRIEQTISREQLWRAQTPQVFRAGQLHDALVEVGRSGVLVTDEAQAMERMGQSAALVEGAQTNIKVTVPEDLELAHAFLDDTHEANPIAENGVTGIDGGEAR